MPDKSDSLKWSLFWDKLNPQQRRTSYSLLGWGAACCAPTELRLGFVLVEPASYVEHFGDVVAGAAADAVWLFRNADEHGFDIEKFQGGVKLLGFRNGCAVVLFAGHHQRRRFDFADLIGQRALHVLLAVVPGIAGKPILCG